MSDHQAVALEHKTSWWKYVIWRSKLINFRARDRGMYWRRIGFFVRYYLLTLTIFWHRKRWLGILTRTVRFAVPYHTKKMAATVWLLIPSNLCDFQMAPELFPTSVWPSLSLSLSTGGFDAQFGFEYSFKSIFLTRFNLMRVSCNWSSDKILLFLLLTHFFLVISYRSSNDGEEGPYGRGIRINPRGMKHSARARTSIGRWHKRTYSISYVRFHN